MAKRPYSDAEIRPETPEILRHLGRMHYRSPEWSADAGIKQRGLGIAEANDGFGDRVYQIDTVPRSDKEKI